MSPPEVTVNGRNLRVGDGISAAAALLNAGETRFRTSVSGAPRGPLCAMGICFECRAAVDGTENRRTCLEAAGAAAAARLPPGRFDVAVVGAGPAGIAAAAAAAESGKRTALLDSGASPGGQIWRRGEKALLPPAADSWLARLERSGAIVIGGAEVVGIRPGFRILVDRENGALEVAADRVVLATGARERFLPFPGWTLPNVFGVGGAQALAKSGASFAGKRVVLAGSGPLLLPAAATLSKHGARVVLVAEQAPPGRVLRFAAGLWRTPRLWAEAARYRRAFRPARYAPGTWVVEATGDDRVRAVTLTDGRRRWTEECDVLATGYGLVPNTEIARFLGCRMTGEAVAVDDRQETSVSGVFCAGEPTGIGGVERALAEGEIAGLACAGSAGGEDRLLERRASARRHGERLEHAFRLRPELRSIARDDTIVCRCEDVRLGEIRADWSPRQAKLYTRAGMGPCQGRICGPALSYHFGWGSDTVRFPLFPASIGAILALAEESEGARTGEGRNEAK